MIFSIFRVSGHSMEPTFKSGQTLLVSSLPFMFRQPKVGDVVVIRDPRDQRLLLKRIINTSNKKIFVTGDNIGHSRTLGPVLKKLIIGKVFLRI